MSMGSRSNAGGNRRNNEGRGSSPCGACKFLRRKCLPSCIFAPYFDPQNGVTRFASVHKVFGASNVSKLLKTIPIHSRPEAVFSIIFEAHARIRDPIRGCVAHINTLQQKIANLQNELAYLQAQLAELPQPPPPQPPLQQPSMAAELSSLFHPMAQQSPRNMVPQRAMDLCYQYGSGGSTFATGSGVVSSVSGGSGGDGGVSGVSAGGDGGGGDLHTLACEFIHRHGNASVVSASGVAAGTNASLSHSSAK